MRRADRLFDILQTLRAARAPVTAATLAEALEVSARTIYRDVATLQARRIPIAGEAGVGYVLGREFSLPPLMFSEDEVEAIAIGARMLARAGDRAMVAAAERVLAKVTLAVPPALREHLAEPPGFVPSRRGEAPAGDLAPVRAAIRDRRKLRLAYRDEQGRASRRTIWPAAIAYGRDGVLIAAWCELRNDFRHFRADRVRQAALLDEPIPISARALRRRWLAAFEGDQETVRRSGERS